jgi:hypothetical protein
MNKKCGIIVGTFILLNQTSYLLNKLPTSYDRDIAIQISYEHPTVSVVGSNAIVAGLTGQQTFIIFNPYQADQLRPTVVSSFRSF